MPDNPTENTPGARMTHIKVLAAQLLLGQRAWQSQMGDPEQRHLRAASALLSGIVFRGTNS